MDTKPSTPIDPVDYFIKQCETLRVGVKMRSMALGKPEYFGPKAAIEVLHAIGRYLIEHPELEDPK